MKLVVISSLLLGCLSANAQELPIKQNHLDYIDKLVVRDTSDLDMVVIHATEQPDWPKSRLFAEKIRYESGTGAAGHYYIDRQGNIEQYVPDDRRSNHASGWNSKTLSIELINTGRWPNATHSDFQHWPQEYPTLQIDAMVDLIKLFKSRYPTIKYVQGHGDVDQRLIPSFNDVNAEVHRRLDPGSTFPWDDVVKRIRLIREMPEREE